MTKIKKDIDGYYYIKIDKADKLIAKRTRLIWSAGHGTWRTKDWGRALCAAELLGYETAVFTNILGVNRVKNPKGMIWKFGKHLFPYQREGVERILSQKNTLLADEQGLGKTVQVIEACYLMQPKKTLIICPASIKFVWAEQWAKWGDSTDVLDVVIGGKHNIRPDANVIVVNYDLMARRHIHDQLLDLEFDVVAYDEAHYLKNPKAKRTKAVFGITKNVERKIMVTGTPMTNRPIDVYALIRFMNKATIEPHADYRKFGYYYCAGYEGRFGFDCSGASNIDELHYKLKKTLMIRRLKKDVLPDLPDKLIQLVPLEQTPETNRIVKLESEFNIADLKKQPELGAIGEMATLRRELGMAKLPQAISHIETTLANVNKLVVFAYSKDVCEKLVEALETYNPVMIYGATPSAKRQSYVTKFQEDETCRVFIGQIQAAGVGLTLTAASHIVFVENTWLYADLEQAVDRCHRIGQKDTVNADILVVKDSLDETMLKYIFDKKKVANELIDGGTEK